MVRSWSNDLAGWSGATPMNNDERQLIQVKMIKDDPATADYTKVWIYRNMVYAYPWCGCSACPAQLAHHRVRVKGVGRHVR
eukprot:SAG31_NODE_457_length_15415_cov_4.380387_22_plen_81_part_00